jgi:hypothetical protein
MQFDSEGGFSRFGEIDGQLADRIVVLEQQRRAIVEENPVQLAAGTAVRTSRAALCRAHRRKQVRGRPAVHQVSGALGVVGVVRFDLAEAFDEIGSVHKDRSRHSQPPESKTPKGSARPG